MPPQRVMHLISQLDVGGTEKQLLLLVPELEKNVHNEVICCMGHGPIGAALEQRGIPVHYLSGRRRTDPRIAWRLWRVVRRTKPGVLITYLIYSDILGRVIGRLAGVKTIIESHRSSLFGSPWWHQVDRFTRLLVTHYTSQTEATKNLLHQVVKIPREKITVIPNAVAIDKKPPALHDEIIMICVANLKPEKDLPLLLEAFARVSIRYPKTQLWLVGEGPERIRVEDQIAASPARSRIHLLGLRDDVPALLSQADIFVLPTRIEGMSNALLEAMALGLPCVTSDIPVNQAVITSGKNGLLFRIGDSHSLEQQLEKVLADATLRTTLGRAAAEHAAQTYSIAAVTQQWLRLLDKIS